MFQHATKYNTQMTNILLRFFDLEIKKQADYRREGQIYLESVRGFGEGEKAQSIVGSQET